MTNLEKKKELTITRDEMLTLKNIAFDLVYENLDLFTKEEILWLFTDTEKFKESVVERLKVDKKKEK